MPLLTYVNIEKDTVFLNQMRSFSNQNCLQNFENYKNNSNFQGQKNIWRAREIERVEKREE